MQEPLTAELSLWLHQELFTVVFTYLLELLCVEEVKALLKTLILETHVSLSTLNMKV